MLAVNKELANTVVSEKKLVPLSESNSSVRHGQLDFKAGHVYKGDIIDGMMSGKGTLTWVDSANYTGEFNQNSITGTGNYRWRDNSQYHGQVQDSMRHGEGHFVHGPSGGQYTGGWKNGQLNGEGRLAYDGSGSVLYKGQWQDGLKQGYGIMQYSSGNVFEGEWSNNMRHGQGTMKWTNKQQQYTGTWEMGYPEGHGVYIWNVGLRKSSPFCSVNKYEGQFSRGKRNGYGIFYYSNGALYKGEWKENMKDGYGRYVSSTGRVYEGMWVRDRPTSEDIIKTESADQLYYFPIASLVPSGSSLKVHQRAVNQVIQRHQLIFKRAYATYSKISKFALDPLENFMVASSDYQLQLWQFWELLKDCGATKKGYSLVSLDRKIFQPLLNFFIANLPSFYEKQAFSMHNYKQKLNYYEFVALLLNLSTCLYGNSLELPFVSPSCAKNDSDIHDVGLGNCLANLVKLNLLPNLSGDSVSAPGHVSKNFEADNINSARYSALIELFGSAISLASVVPGFNNPKTSKSNATSRPPTASTLTTRLPAEESLQLQDQNAAIPKPAQSIGSGKLAAVPTAIKQPAKNFTSRPSSAATAQLLNNISQLTGAPSDVAAKTAMQESKSSAIESLEGTSSSESPSMLYETSMDLLTWSYIVQLVKLVFNDSVIDKLESVYNKLSKCRRKQREVGDNSIDRTITVRGLIKLLQSCNMMETKGSFTLQRLISYFKKACPAVVEDGALNLETELVLSEFFDAMIAFSLLKSERKIMFVIKPLLKQLSHPVSGSASFPTLEALLEKDVDDFSDEAQKNTWCMMKLHSVISAGGNGPLGDLGAALEAELLTDVPAGVSGTASSTSANANYLGVGMKAGAAIGKAKTDRLNSASKSTLSGPSNASGAGAQVGANASVLSETKRGGANSSVSRAPGNVSSVADKAAGKVAKPAVVGSVPNAANSKVAPSTKDKIAHSGNRRTATGAAGSTSGTPGLSNVSGTSASTAGNMDGAAAAYALSNIDISSILDSPVTVDCVQFLKTAQEKVLEQVNLFVDSIHKKLSSL